MEVDMRKFIFLFALLFSSASLAAPRYIVTMPKGENVLDKIAFFNNSVKLKEFSAEIKEIKPEKVFNSIDSFVAPLSNAQVEYLRSTGATVQPDGEKHILGFPDKSTFSVPEAEDYTYGLKNIGVPELRKSYPDVTGKGVVVGIIDTGIDPNHPAFKGKKIVFKDFTSQNKKDPYDDNGHGTHVAGTITGLGSLPAYGIAPDVELVVAKVFSASGGATDSILLEAMEWMLSQNVRVVSNSWGGSQDDTALENNPYNKMVQAWVDKNIFPSFAAGNEGPSSRSVGIPGGLPIAYAVGAVDSADKTASFSSRGPIEWDDVSYDKPEICAPGVKVYSSVPGGKYASYSGTSMATPHLSGVVALMLSAKPCLTVEETKKILAETSKNIQAPLRECGSGRLDALAAVEKSKAL
jgi:subtilisin family serine protease